MKPVFFFLLIGSLSTVTERLSLAADPQYSDMTPIFQLAKEFMKGREVK